MQPHMEKNDMIMFHRYLEKSAFYFEFGSGGSTYQASTKQNIKRIVSVESDIEWHNKLKSLISNECVDFVYCNMQTIPNTWGHPGKNSTIDEWRKYSGAISEYGDIYIDTILIDGRFRVACCLKCFDVISDNCFVIFDDFLDRPCYHAVLEFFDIIERTSDNRMVVLRKKPGPGPGRELIAEYESIPG